MKNYKNELIRKLDMVVKSIFNNPELIKSEITDEGFHCDFDLQLPINPDMFSKISKLMKNKYNYDNYELSRFSGVYENGDSNLRMLQRIYIIIFDTKEELVKHKEFIAQAQKQSHQKIGSQLKLFSSSQDIGQGLVLWHPKGAMLRYLIQDFGQKAHMLNGYDWVYTPHIGRADLWQKSGHLEFYKDAMYSPIQIDDEEYYLKPMNCPFHVNIYNSEPHSYRDLPVRFAEYGTVYRYELSGALNGLTRVRGFTQDDAHIICREDQLKNELSKALQLSIYILNALGFDDFHAYVSTKPKEKYIGDDKQWNKAIAILEDIVKDAGIKYDIDEGGGAFYGPKIDLKLKDSLNREWQCSTIQFDFNLPLRFDMNYIGSDDKKHTPFMIHRALFGSIERFTALLIEHYKGDFPLWFAPIQFGIIPINSKHNEYCTKLALELKKSGFRVKLDDEKANMRNKIKAFELEKIPFIIIVGDNEMNNSTFSLRSRKDGNIGEMNIDDLRDYIIGDIEKGTPVPIYN